MIFLYYLYACTFFPSYLYGLNSISGRNYIILLGLQDASGNNVLVITGPAGVGKSVCGCVNLSWMCTLNIYISLLWRTYSIMFQTSIVI